MKKKTTISKTQRAQVLGDPICDDCQDHRDLMPKLIPRQSTLIPKPILEAFAKLRATRAFDFELEAREARAKAQALMLASMDADFDATRASNLADIAMKSDFAARELFEQCTQLLDHWTSSPEGPTKFEKWALRIELEKASGLAVVSI